MYTGIIEQIRKNNTNSVLMLIAFPVLLLAMTYAIIFLLGTDNNQQNVNNQFLQFLPYVLAGTGIWFLIAWFSNTAIIRNATGAQSLSRKDNMRVYNLLENLCIAEGMRMPKLNIIEDNSLNAFASGINEQSYTITLSRGIIDKLNDEELEGVIAHELVHIKNKDVRLLIVSIIFVGIFAFLAEMAFRNIYFSNRRSKDKDGGGGAAILIIIAVTAAAYLISLLLRFGISRKREYMADAGAAEITKKPYALAAALRKISADPNIEAVSNREVAQLFIDNPLQAKKGFSLNSIFATHPPIEKRIKLLEQYA